MTEFAVCCTHDQSKVTEFVKVRSRTRCQVQGVRLSCQGIVPRLEAAEFVHRYSWFITRGNQHGDGGDGGWFLDSSDLFIEDSPQLSAVGSLYDML